MPFDYNLAALGCNVLYIPPDMLVDSNTLRALRIGIGDICYAVGLFRLMAGSRRNLPVIHTGRIALIPEDERIPVQDWLNPNGPRKHIEGYLVKLQNLKGLSGSPVTGAESRACGAESSLHMAWGVIHPVHVAARARGDREAGDRGPSVSGHDRAGRGAPAAGGERYSQGGDCPAEGAAAAAEAEAVRDGEGERAAGSAVGPTEAQASTWC